MTYFEYIFHCKKLPTRLTLHSIASHFFETKDLSKFNFKVFQEGKLVKILTDHQVEKEFSVELTDKKGVPFECKLFKVKEHDAETYEKGDEVTISGIIEYGMNIGTGKRCPIFLGKFKDESLRTHFKSHIENILGVKIPDMSRDYFSRLESEIADDHIHFNNLLDMDLPVIVENPVLFNQVSFKSFFQKKSYGFGNLEVIA